jgi:hypothetical protein
MGMSLPGLGFFVIAMATTAACLIGALVQIAWMSAVAPKGRAGSRAAAGLVGPVCAAVIGLAAMWVAEDRIIAGETLDDLWFVLPSLQLAVWVLLTRSLLGMARDGDDPQVK